MARQLEVVRYVMKFTITRVLCFLLLESSQGEYSKFFADSLTLEYSERMKQVYSKACNLMLVMFNIYLSKVAYQKKIVLSWMIKFRISTLIYF